MLLTLALVLTAGVTTVFAWPMVFSPDEKAAQGQPSPKPDNADRPAASHPPHSPAAGNHLHRILGHMELSKEQKAKVGEVLKAHHDAVRKFMEKVHADLHKELKAILTSEQFQQLEKEMKRHHAGTGHAPAKGAHDKDHSGK
jgi:hypothetical protein